MSGFHNSAVRSLLKVILLVLLMLSLSGGGILLFLRKPQTIRRTTTGFVPERAVVIQGRTVSFISDVHSFWPASDPHPTHFSHPSLDSRGPIAPGISWEYTPLEPGIFSYHDHLNHDVGGVLYVIDTSSVHEFIASFFRSIQPDWTSTSVSSEKCIGMQDGIQSCWESFVKEYLVRHDVNRTVDEIRTLTDSFPEFVPYCHDMMHIVGRYAAREVAHRSRNELSNRDLTQCSYGFYHGFMEYTVGNKNDFQRAIAFCSALEALPQGDEISGSCYHGMGHGVAISLENGDTQNPWEYLLPGIAVCEQYTDPVLSSCVGGVIDGIASLYTGGVYEIEAPLKSNPYTICSFIPSSYSETCYLSLSWFVVHVAGGDISKGLKYTDGIPVSERTYVQLNQQITDMTVQYLKLHNEQK